MKLRAALLLVAAAAMGASALSVGGRLYWLMGLTMLFVLLLGLLSSLWAYATVRVTCAVGETAVPRGSQAVFSYTVAHSCPLPIAPVKLTVHSPEAEEGKFARIAATPFRVNLCRQRVYCPHVGRYAAGITRVTAEDVFGLFSFSKKTDTWAAFTVLPRTLPTDALPYSPGEDDSILMARATEDNAAPADVRAYQQGDELKKIHWKLSMRKREILVKTYEQPMRPDALLLLDPSRPDCDPARFPAIRDTLLEQTASLIRILREMDAPVRMPLFTQPPRMLTYAHDASLAAMGEDLAALSLDAKIKFERVLLGETRRMQKSGGIAVLTTRLTPVVTDLLLRFRRMGPRVRLYLVRDSAHELRHLINRLIQADVEVRIVRPERDALRQSFLPNDAPMEEA